MTPSDSQYAGGRAANGPIMLSIVIPIYNNAETLQELSKRLTAVLSGEGVDNHEVIFVDDGSKDRSRIILRDLCRQDPRIKLIGLTRNFGHQFAITAGFDSSRGDAVLVMDGDLQDPPEVIPEFLKKLREGYDVVYGIRLERQGESRFKRWTAALFYRALRHLTHTEIVLDSGDFRLMSRRAMDSLNHLRERARFVRGMVSWLGYPQAAVYYKRAPRAAGSSQYSLKRLVKLALDGVFSFSDVPLRMATWIGFLGVGICLLFFGFIIYDKLVIGVPVQGWASLTAIVLFIGSVQLVLLGVIGQYIGRMYEELKNRPLYIVQERGGFSDRKEFPQP